MGRKLHLIVTRDTFLLKRDKKGRIVPVGLIGYEPPDMFPQALLRAGGELKQFTEKSTSKEMIFPSQEYLMVATYKEKEQWARHIISKGKVPPPGACSGADHARKKCDDHIREFLIAQETYKQYRLMKKLTASLVSAQQEFIQTGEWIDKKKVTISMLAAEVDDFSEKTVSRVMYGLKLKYNEMTFHASDLLCGSHQSALCKALLPSVRIHPDFGAPRLTRVLKETTDIQVSVRSVSIALDILRRNLLV